MGTFAMTAGMGLRAILQAGVVLIIARVLGVKAYGAYAAVLAIAGALGSFCGSGTLVLMLRDVARDPMCFAAAWGRVLASIVVSVPILFGVYLLLARIILPVNISWSVILLMGLAELVFAPLMQAAISAYQSHERIGRASRLVFIAVLPRFLGAVALILLSFLLPSGMRLIAWSALYALAALVAAIYAMRLVRYDLGAPRKPEGLWLYLTEGLIFAIGGAAHRVYQDIDKAMLAKLSTLDAAGVYSAGYRLVDLSMIPLNAVLAATLTRFFRAGESGPEGGISYGWRILPLPLIYAVFIGFLLYGIAGLLPLALGASFQGAILTLRWLSWLPVLSIPRMFLTSLLVGSDKQRVVTIIYGIGAMLNILLNLWLIPLFSWRGAVASTYSAEIATAVALLLSVWHYKQQNS